MAYHIWLQPKEGNGFWHGAYFLKEEKALKAVEALKASNYYTIVALRKW